MAEFGEPLSERELDVLQQVVSGAANKQIALALSISPNTVKVHLRNVYTKLGVSSRAEATRVAIEQSLVEIDLPEPEIGPQLDEEDAAPEVEETTEVEGVEPAPAVAPALIPEAEADGATAVALPTENTTASHTPALPTSRRSRWWLLLGLLVLLPLAGIGIWQISQEGLFPTVEPTPEAFEETPLGDSRWFVSRPLNSPRTNHLLVPFGLDLYQIGGEDTEGAVRGDVFVFDTATSTWTAAASKPTPATEATAAELFGLIYVIGGRSATGDLLNIVEAYSPANDQWLTATALPQNLAGSTVLTDGSFLYLFGGEGEAGVQGNSYLYDPGADGWRPLPDLPQPVAYATGGYVAGKFYLVGGNDGLQAVDTCQFYDPDTDAWDTCDPLVTPRERAGAAVILNKLYVIGGRGPEALDFGELYDPNTNLWQLINIPMLDGESEWLGLGVAHIERRLFTVGGMRGGVAQPDMFVYAPLIYQTFIPAAVDGGP